MVTKTRITVTLRQRKRKNWEGGYPPPFDGNNNKDIVEVDYLEAALDTSSSADAAVHHTVLRKDFESVLDYLEAKYVKSLEREIELLEAEIISEQQQNNDDDKNKNKKRKANEELINSPEGLQEPSIAIPLLPRLYQTGGCEQNYLYDVDGILGSNNMSRSQSTAAAEPVLPAEIGAVVDEIIPLVTDHEAHYANQPARKQQRTGSSTILARGEVMVAGSWWRGFSESSCVYANIPVTQRYMAPPQHQVTQQVTQQAPPQMPQQMPQPQQVPQAQEQALWPGMPMPGIVRGGVPGGAGEMGVGPGMSGGGDSPMMPYPPPMYGIFPSHPMPMGPQPFGMFPPPCVPFQPMSPGQPLSNVAQPPPTQPQVQKNEYQLLSREEETPEAEAGQLEPPQPHPMVAQSPVDQQPPPPRQSSSSSVASNPPSTTTPVQLTGRWTAEEHCLFLQGLEQNGKKWKKIASLIKSRTVNQIRTHAQKYFQKLAKARQNGEQVEGDMDGSGTGGGNGNHGQVMATRDEETSTPSYPQITMRTTSHYAGNGGKRKRKRLKRAECDNFTIRQYIPFVPIPKSTKTKEEMDAIMQRARAAAGYTPPTQGGSVPNGDLLSGMTFAEYQQLRPPAKKVPRPRKGKSRIPSSTPKASSLKSQQQKWDEMFNYLVKFIEETRQDATKDMPEEKKKAWVWDGNVPTNYKTKCGKALGRWINNQRSEKAAGTLKDGREVRLVSTGLKWSVQFPSWRDMFRELQIYVTEQTKDGRPWDGNVPTNYKIRSTTDGEEKKLGRWINRQRSLFQAGKLKQERQMDLERIGLKWSVSLHISWSTMYDELCAFAEARREQSANGVWDGQGPSNHKSSLGGWVKRQRSAYAKGQLKEDQVQKLENLGFKWKRASKKKRARTRLTEKRARKRSRQSQHSHDCNINKHSDSERETETPLGGTVEPETSSEG